MAPAELDLSKAIVLGRKRAGLGGGSKRGDDDANSNGNKSGKNKSDDSGERGEKDHQPDSPQSPGTPYLPSSTFIATLPTSIAQATLTATAWTTIPTTVVITSIASAPSFSISSSVMIAPTTASSIPSTLPTTASILASITSFTLPASASSQPREGFNTDDDLSSTSSSCISSKKAKTKTTSSAQSTTMVALADTDPTPTPTASLDISQKQDDHDNDKNPGGLSPTAEHLLIAFGAIGAFILLMAAVYFYSRMKKIDLSAKARGGDFNRGGPRGWYGWRERESDYTMDEPPKYAGYNGLFEYASEQKAVPVQKQLDAFVSQRSLEPMAHPQSAATFSRVNTQRQGTVRESLLEDSAPFGLFSAQPPQQSAAQTFYNTTPSYDPSSVYSQTYNPNNAMGGTSRQRSDVYNPAQREVNHMSYLSSLSSGFGDQIIIPELGTSQTANGQAPQQQSRKFSWANSSREPQSTRDTIYVDASVESSPPRFRTINSWVAQQTGHVERQNQANNELGSMPSIPKPLQFSKMGAAVAHRRNQSEDPAFKHHPGDEIEMSKGTRIPSTILDAKFGSN